MNRLSCFASLIVLASSLSARATVLYRENFGATSGMSPLSTVGWQGYQGNASTAATAVVSGSSGDPANAMLSGGPSAPSNGPNVNAGAAAASTTQGFVPMLSKDGLRDFVMFTDEYAFDPATSAGPGETLSFQWYAGSYYAGDFQRPIVRINGVWYASVAGAEPAVIGTTMGGMAFGPNSRQIQIPFSTDAGAWRILNFTPGSPLSLGDVLTTPLPAGTIDAFGIYAEIANNTSLNTGGTEVGDERTFFDQFEIATTPLTSVPEPALAPIAALAAFPLLTRRSCR